MNARSVMLLPAILLVMAGSSLAAPARLINIELREWRLSNGLHVIFAPHRGVPGVTVQVWYHVGSKNEHPGIRGIAHLFEHMMFKGSEHVPPEQHARMISALGGNDNAFTLEDVTGYFDNVPREYMEFAMRLEAERMRYLHLTKFTIASEREVVKEEKRMRLDNSPIGRTLESIRALAYSKHPYAWTPAGEEADLNQITVETCRRFYDTYYRPNNASLIVVGDVDEAAVRVAAERQFGSIARGPEPPPVTAVEPRQSQLREQVANWPSQLNVVLGAYHISAARAPDQAALKVVSALLSAGQSSRLNQALVRKGKLAVAAGGFAQSLEQPGLFFVYAVGLPNHDLQRMKQALLDEVARLTKEQPEAKELAKVRNQLATQAVSRLRTMDGLASEIGRSLYLRGDARAFLTEAAKIDQVSGADVKQVAQRYLIPTNLNLILLPAATGTNGGAR